MKNRRKNIQKLTFLALSVTVSLILSYVESLLPPLFASVPGIKLGLPNIVIIFLLYRFGICEAASVSFLRILLGSVLFGNFMTLAYSVAGAVLSLMLMLLLRKLDCFSMIGVSVAGGVSHNLGQILMAMLLLDTAEIGYYMLVLAVTGTISGIFVGLCSSFLLKRLSIKKI